MAPDELVSPNNWLVKAGAELTGDHLKMPHKFLLIPLSLASESIISFRKSNNLGEKIKHGLIVTTMVRIADTAFYTFVAKLINNASPNTPNICHVCIRGQICCTQMRRFRKIANGKIIHKMENGSVIKIKDLGIVEKYYEEIFKLPLVDPVSFPERKGIKLCQRCAPKWRNLTNQ